ncbi:S8 family serine peptidase [Pseudoclavibacter chungangensis]|uniref:S8 family serine peptidase n=1 Tax=Pseudoclavibacter chungangensis TaxID=587635 RepID=A0A7J5C2N4_9MICO|nr:S8 family serine peptidase [Pseudoclavibacter chungangensis]KAB1662452.1 S8 family serine peptidase [Pseudoclavibacter chungangensis]NYJ68483.1 hypothetical protein [Pseudoclavibacter chungangensis]
MSWNSRTGAGTRPRGYAVAATLATVIALPLGAGVATGATPEPDPYASVQDGTWYFDKFGIGSIHAEGITGAGITVAVLDTPINPDVPDLRGTDLEPRTEHVCPNGYDGISDEEEAGHGTSMTSVIIGNDAGVGDLRGIPGVAPDAKVLHYAVLSDPNLTGCDITLADSVQDAVDNGARIISMSLGWGDTDDVEEAVLIAHRAGAIVDIAVQNEDGDDLDDTSGANGVVAIENMTASGGSDGREVHSDRLTGVAPGVNIRGPAYGDGSWDAYHLGVGSSPATAWVSGVLALTMQRWPEATSNQIIQSLIRNTTNDWPELSRTDLEGFGLFSPQNLMLWDPTRYPDVNPLLTDRNDAFPSWQDVMGSTPFVDPGFTEAGVGFGTSIPSAVPTKVPPSFWVTAPGIRTIIGIVLLVLLAVAVVLFVVRVRSGRPVPLLERRGGSQGAVAGAPVGATPFPAPQFAGTGPPQSGAAGPFGAPVPFGAPTAAPSGTAFADAAPVGSAFGQGDAGRSDIPQMPFASPGGSAPAGASDAFVAGTPATGGVVPAGDALPSMPAGTLGPVTTGPSGTPTPPARPDWVRGTSDGPGPANADRS